MSNTLVHESLSIFVVRQGLIGEFLTVNDFTLKLDVIQFIDELCLIRSYHNIACRCKPELEKKLIRRKSWKENSMILQNRMIQRNRIIVLIDIIELIVLSTPDFFLSSALHQIFERSTD